MQTNKTDVTLVQATRTDVPVILRYIHKLAEHEGDHDAVIATEKSLEQTLFDQNAARVYLVTYEQETVGFVVLSRNMSTYSGKTVLFLEDLYLDHQVRGLGLGKRIFALLQLQAKAENCGRIEWTCLRTNQSGIDFYDAIGATAMDSKVLYRLIV
ncbi:MAG: GNAT family N-acetyltransferase [Culicoidibacterales bacterium]